ncbi:hypothetical protein [Chryseobacterium arthrosphaerae]|uniref:hypothetical protein n=1 Tax=Chryseobacterium arthrosphaerae TaxID=651561 RepID=UPI0031D04D37
MILTENALADFARWSHDRTAAQTPLPNDLFELLQQSLIIEWFDLVKINIHVDITSSYYLGKIYVTSLDAPDFAEKYYHNVDRKHVTNQLIKKANEIYNTTH